MARRRRSSRSNPALRRNQAILTVVFCLAVIGVLGTSCWMLLHAAGPDTAAAAQPQSAPAESDAASSAAPSLEAPPADSGETPAESAAPAEEDALAQAMAVASTNCTKDAPQVTDPSTWNEAGKALMDRLSSDEFFVSEGINVNEKEGFPYLIAVNRAASTVTVYTLDEEGRYTVPFMAMVCSGGTDTPLGFFATPVNYDWRLLAGPSYGQYATRIWDSYLFHSVPYYSQHKDDVEYVEFNKLGTIASLGCIRMAVVDTKWIYDNCAIGTRVIIYDDESNPGPMGKPGTIYTDPDDTEKRGWDPTDPDPANPWDDQFLSGTAIRSQAAWDQWNDAMAAGTWNNSVTATDLQGWSTDASIEGTRG